MSKFLSGVIFITMFSLLYVYQQTEVFRLAYLGQKKQSVFDDLLDKNVNLRYNIGRKASLVHIGTNAGLTDFQMPNTYQLMRFTSTKEGMKLAQKTIKKETLLARIFSVKRQAEAKD
ncbi:MAG: hypothetical protein WC628_07065 [Candidatus Omnitrophota bacterium]